MTQSRKVSISILSLVFLLMSCVLPSLASANATQVDGWTKIASNGIDNPATMFMFPSLEFHGKLFFWVPGGGSSSAPVWAYDGTTFSHAAADGFGDANNITLNAGVVFGDYLYMSTANKAGSGQVWRTQNGTNWQQVGQGTIGGPNDNNCSLLGVQDGRLIISFSNYSTGAQAWSYDGSTFARANTDGFGMNIEDVTTGPTGATFDGRIETLGSVNMSNTFKPIQYSGGTTWTQTAPDNFGDPNNGAVVVTSAKGAVWTGTSNPNGGQLWRFDASGWTHVPTPGVNLSGGVTCIPWALGDELELATSVFTQGSPSGPARVYRQNPDGSFYLWIDQFGDPGNLVIAASLYNGQYIAGAGNINGFQIWSKPAPTTFFFAEGTTRPDFDTYFCIQNPGSATASATLTYMKGDGTTAKDQVSVPPHSRLTVNTGNTLGTGNDPGHDFSTEVTCTNGQQIVVERPMYFNYNGVWTGGHDVVGAATPSSTFYFAEGTTRPDFDPYFCILNSGNVPASVKLTYMLGNGKTQSQAVSVPASTRATVHPADVLGTGNDSAHDFSTKITSSRPIVAERPMYFNYKGVWTGGSDAMGTTSTSTTYYFAEGNTRTDFDPYLTIGNPGGQAASVRVTYMRGDGTEADQLIQVDPRTRVTLHPADSIGVGNDVAHDFSAKVQSTNGVGIVAERAMYFDYKGVWTGGHDVVGTTFPSTTFDFAEGTCRPDFDPYFCIENPGSTAANVSLTYMKGDGTTATDQVTVPPNSRSTVLPRNKLGTGNDPAHDFSSKVTCTNGQQIIVERPMYFNYRGVWTGGHDVVGFTQ